MTVLRPHRHGFSNCVKRERCACVRLNVCDVRAPQKSEDTHTHSPTQPRTHTHTHTRTQAICPTRSGCRSSRLGCYRVVAGWARGIVAFQIAVVRETVQHFLADFSARGQSLQARGALNSDTAAAATISKTSKLVTRDAQAHLGCRLNSAASTQLGSCRFAPAFPTVPRVTHSFAVVFGAA